MTVSPGLPEAYLPLTWHGLRVGSSRVDVQVDGTDHGRATGLPRGFEIDTEGAR
jgi:hypothetical protein